MKKKKNLFNINKFEYKQDFDIKNIIIYKICQSIFIIIFNKAPNKDKILNCIYKSIINLIFS